MTAEQIFARLNKEGPAWARQNRRLILGWLRGVYGRVVLTPEQRVKARAAMPMANLNADPLEIILDNAIEQTEAAIEAAA